MREVGQLRVAKSGGLAIDFFEGVGGVGDVPVGPAVEVLGDADFDGSGSVVADFDFEGFVDRGASLFSFKSVRRRSPVRSKALPV